MKYIEIDFDELANHSFIRFDYKFHKIQKFLSKNWTNIGSLFNIINGISCTEYYSEDKTNLSFIRIGDLSFGEEIDEENLIYLDESFQIPKEKILQKDDLILATIGNTIGKINLANNLEGGTFSNNTALLRLKNRDNHNIKFYEKLIKSKKIQEIIWCFVSQKAQPNLQDYDLKKIPLPQIPLSTQNEAVAKIQPIEQQIKELKSKIIDQKQIINEVFAREFGFDLEKFEELKKEKMFFVGLQDFSNNQDVRFSSKFHRPSAKFVYDELKKITNTKIKDFLSEPIVLGSGISPADFYESGEIKYLGMSNIKNWYVDNESMQFVSSDFANRNKIKRTEINDIVLARSGEGTIGKVALIENDCEAIFADFTMRIRFDNEKLNSTFAYYYFRTEYFQYLVEVNKKGLGNNTNIFPSQICEFPIPNLPLSHQHKIVNEIKAKIDKQNEINKQIETLRGKIDEIINEVVESVN